ncbi:MAG: peptidoglycan DD-metalloendopeptidase family protein [Sneathiella sp.]
MKLKPAIDKLFVERQIIISTQGQLKYFKVGKWAQGGTLAGVLSVVGIVALLSVHNGIQVTQIAAQDKLLTLMQEKVRSVSSRLISSKSNLALTKSELDQQYVRLEEILSERQNLKSTLQAATTNLRQKTSALDTRDQYASNLEGRIQLLSERLRHTNDRSEKLSLQITKINKALYHTTEERDQIAEAKLIAQKKLSSLNRELQMFQSNKDEISNDLQNTRDQLSSFGKERSRQRTKVQSLQNQIVDLKSRITTISVENKDLITRVYKQTVQGIDALKETITLTGLNPDEILSLDNVEGKGGPFYDLSQAQDLLKIEEDYYEDAQKMEISIARWTTLNTILENIPLARPTERGYVSSSFGTRRDPIKKKKAFHAGMDISGPKNTKIFSTAPGIITAAHRSGAYGLMVEIDHGQGFKTKFGHMKKIYVKKGQKVDFRTKIGLMGSTGRSTGRHVHYEISYNGKPQDPAKFFKAGNYAFKTVPKKDK